MTPRRIPLNTLCLDLESNELCVIVGHKIDPNFVEVDYYTNSKRYGILHREQLRILGPYLFEYAPFIRSFDLFKSIYPELFI